MTPVDGQSPVSVRDRRRLPFVMVTKAAIEAIRQSLDSRRGQTALAVYVAIVECANDARSESFETPRKVIAKLGMVNVRVLDSYVRQLEEMGLVHVERQGADGRPNRWTLTDPPAVEAVTLGARGEGTQGALPPVESADTPPVHAADKGGVQSGRTPRIQEGKKLSPSNDGESAGHTTTVDVNSLPADFPAALEAVARDALVVLCRIQVERGGNMPTLRGVALAVRQFVDRDHLQVAGELEHWATVGRGQNRPVRDWPRQYRAFLERAPSGSAPSSPSSTAGRDARRARRAAALGDLVAGSGVAA